MKSKGPSLDTIDEDWIYNCVDLKQLMLASELLGKDKAKKDLKRMVDERLSLLAVGPSASQKKEAERIRLKGNECVGREDYKGAMEYYTSSIKLDPTEASNFANRALTHLRMKNFKQAMVDALRAIKVNKEYGRGYQRLAEAYLGLKDYRNGYIALKATLKREPANKTVLRDLVNFLGKHPHG